MKLLVANRGEIAVRIIRTAREMGIPTVAVYSTADADTLAVDLADEAVCIGPPPARDSYLNISNVLAAAEITGCDAVHPGYGFLAESAAFAQAAASEGVTFVGPSPEVMQRMGDKIAAKAAAREAGLPVLEGSDGPVADVRAAQEAAERAGFPVLLKAAAGGGGRACAGSSGRPTCPARSRWPSARPRPRSATAGSTSSGCSRARGTSRCR